MEKITFTIDGKAAEAEPGRTILEAALDNGVYIPHLCGHESLAPAGACGMCAVKIKGAGGVSMACSTIVAEGMDIDTRDELAEKVRKLSCDFIFKTHPSECTGCPKYGKCQLQTISQYVGDTGRKLRENKLVIAADDSNPVILHEMHRCILCGRCVRACADMRGVGAIRFEKVKGRMRVVVDGDSLSDAGCRFCAACVDVCPTGSIREHEAIAAKMEGKTREEALVPCRGACPAHIDVPRYIRYIREGEFAAAAEVVREKAPFPVALGYVCTHPCEPECKRSNINHPVSIRNLKRYAAQQAAQNAARHEAQHTPQQAAQQAAQKAAQQAAQNAAQQTSQNIMQNRAQDSACGTAPEAKAHQTASGSVAVVGAGPAGMTAAYFLVRKGHRVTVFEENGRAGGMLRYGIPKHRLPREELDREINEILAQGVVLEENKKIENAPALLEQGFGAVLVTIGAHNGVKLPIPGADLRGVFIGTEFLKASENGEALKSGLGRTMVLGGGSVAFDCAAVARRLGAAEVHIACLEAADSMTSTFEERIWAEEEGVIVHNSKTFLEITGEDGLVTGMKLASVSGFYFDENGKSVIETVPDSEEIIEADSVIFAVGQRPGTDAGFGVEMGRGGRVAVSDDHMTSVPGVFAAGDAATGTASVIKAIAGARTAASMIDVFLGGDGDIDEHPAPLQVRDPYLGKQEGFGGLARNEAEILPPAERVLGFDAMDFGFNSEQAACEAGRCLQCDLRLDISPQRFWTDYSYSEGVL